MTSWVLVHSPLVGPGTWTPVATALRAGGDDVVVPDLRPALRSPAHVRPQVELVAASVGPGPVVLVGHSGAGPLLPLVADALAARDVEVVRSVYVDAGLPHPGRSRLEMLPSELGARLRTMAVDGELPPWTSWWPPEVLAELMPDDALRAALVADCPRLPWTLFTEALPPAPAGSSAYLQLSDAYAEEAATAGSAGWPTHRLVSTHLGVLTEPAETAAALRALVA